MSRSQKSTDTGGIWAMVVGGMLLVLCCAAPVALAGGVFSVLGATLRIPWVFVGGAILAAVAAGLVLRHCGHRTTEKGLLASLHSDRPATGRNSRIADPDL